MPGQRALDKARTRAHIADVATRLFLERGFDAVTVAEVAAAAGVSKVTVFAHFACKEDLLLDRAPEAEQLLLGAVAGAAEPVEALRQLAQRLARDRHPFSGLNGGVQPFLRVLATSPDLLARAREQLDRLERSLAAAIDDPLTAALALAAYRVVVTETVQRSLSGRIRGLAADHLARVERAFVAVAAATARSRPAGRRALPSPDG